MADPSSPSPDGGTDPREKRDDAPGRDADDGDDVSFETFRATVEEKYDFENFGPADMAKMNLDEWEAVFDADSWIVGVELLNRVEQDLKGRIARRDVFAVLERVSDDGDPRLLAYSDEGYAVVYPDGSVEGEGTVVRDVKPTVALCSMDDYEVPSAPERAELPDPASVQEGTGEFGNLMLQVVAAFQLLAGVGLFLAWVVIPDLSTIVAPVMALVFFLVGLFLFGVVANARLSDRFRAQEFRNRLRAAGVEDGVRPAFVPTFDEDTRAMEAPDAGTNDGVDG